MKTVLVSIIIPTYNRAHLIGETIDSVIAQTYKNWECIVVDDGSNDATDEVMQAYCQKDTRIQYYHRSKQHLPGGNGARNYGLLKSRGELIKWFDSDDLAHKNLIEYQVKEINEKKVDLTFCNLKILGSSHGLNPDDNEIAELLKAFITRKIKLNLQTILFTRDLVKKFKFDEELRKAQDLDFIYEVLRAEPTYSFTNKILCELRLHEQRISNDYQKFNKRAIFSSIKVKEKILFNEYKHVIGKEQRALLHQYTYELRLLLVIFEIRLFFYYLNRLKKRSFITWAAYFGFTFKFTFIAIKERFKNIKRSVVNLIKQSLLK